MEKRRTLLAPAVPVVDQQVVPEALGQAAVLVINSLKRSTVTPASLFAKYRSNFRQWRAW